MKPLSTVFFVVIVLLSHFEANGSPEFLYETHYVFEPQPPQPPQPPLPPPSFFQPRPEPVDVMVDITNQLGKLVLWSTLLDLQTYTFHLKFEYST